MSDTKVTLKKEYKNTWDTYSKEDLEKLFAYAERYRKFISDNKTERECIRDLVKKAEAAGYQDIQELIKADKRLVSGDKVYANYKDKTLILFCVGEKPLTEGLNLLGAHLDSPRLDLKPNPLYEDTDFAMLKTHYYGGVKKYQWVAMPLAIHGVVAKKDGSIVNLNIGEDETDPVVGISDLLIHLAGEQMQKKLSEAIKGEDLNICLGSIPLEGEEKDKVKANILKLLYEKYGIVEEDLVSAEIEIVPAGAARDYGLDRSMIIGYGQDDRVCGYASFEAQLEVEKPVKTTATVLVDKEEIGSVGASGMQSHFFENMVAELLNLTGEYSSLLLKRTLASSKMLSSDVTAGYDPNYASVLEKNNAAYFGKGVVFMKYTGSRGKSGSNEANAEFVAELRRIMEENQVSWQTAELGRIDLGGGGTIAYILAHYGMDVIDCGVPVHSMHAPWEITSKADLYEMRKAYVAFLKNA
ncbi:aminopeptidase [Cellulosilyticum lentocellum]|uniref:M18 family aminopeptidase n=1 Tax=Cellulosilyticum lentocellum (strain ATCC 49066 / DSM 5427 / NCIMB 11756 / RHM5) TaxID=642492 RepID=F2JSX5_CELLD|nr:aminopeptidase [Cellulosilyticum lentocellum]ADZ84096.1 peptidase M18 aminopeptidase I [Cellulosilyticum lentocellum DSM 5427]